LPWYLQGKILDAGRGHCKNADFATRLVANAGTWQDIARGITGLLEGRKCSGG